ncbi:hypothetical protein [Dokdonia sp. Hel_I_53]|uniref:hypothetical protein n=1 Tax=Dokdonia sp. Hel_I_53 TaxID=1566287 RepID=UPI0021BD3B2C|nr:hypothetical protein [Dokdonia sp. Hel_I_53]
MRETVLIDTVSINPFQFKVLTIDGGVVDSTLYSINYPKSIFSIKAKREKLPDSLLITYRVYPEFLTKTYRAFDPEVIVNSSGLLNKVISLNTEDKRSITTPFSGLNVTGSILRGVTSGNNQNSTINSELDLQISGKLSEKVTLRASIQDANIPSQQGGYSQNLDEFDQVFIELLSNNWKIRAGDINLQNSESYFGQFTKKIQGLSLGGTINHSDTKKSDLFASGALVRGVFTQSIFTGQEGNQGPYKLTGPNGELFVLIVSGSETVYVNGFPLTRGESEDYVIDYNAGEIRFNPTYPINSEMRINVEYQYSERRYTRFLAYGGGSFQENDKLKISAHVYSESDSKNQPLQQNLTQEQVAILQAAGDNMDQMIAPSAIAETYDENKILYRKILVNGVETFEFSSDPDENLFQVRFTNVGENQGDYILSTTNTLQRTFEYVSPVNGVSQGSFAPQVQLFAPSLLQLAVINGTYTPSNKTLINFEAAGSKNDMNTLSDFDDNNNDGYATHIDLNHQLFSKDSAKTLHVFGKWDYIQESFQNIEGLYNVEFNRDWNLENSLANASGKLLGTQNFTTLGLAYKSIKDLNIVYTFENLHFLNYYNGLKHNLRGAWSTGSLRTSVTASTLTTNDTLLETDFNRINTVAVYDFNKKWIGTHYQLEDNLRVNKRNDSITGDSQRFYEYGAFAGVGDSTNVYIELGYRFRESDSLRLNRITSVNTSDTYYLKSQLIKNEKTNLSLFTNYRTLHYSDDREDENSLNSRLLYDQQFANGIVRTNTVFETNSGTQPQQEFTYLQVDEGQGTFTWNDYNNDTVQQLEEFEIAQFQDQAKYIRVLLPNQVFVRTHQNKISQQVTLNPSQWSGKKGVKKWLARFYNQTSYLLDKRILRSTNDFRLNPYKESKDEIGANISFRNTLFFNRGKQRYTTSYTLLSSNTKNLLSTGLQENDLKSHQFSFLHKVKESWLFNLKSELGFNRSESENFAQRSFDLKTTSWNPTISYLFGKQSRASLFYQFQRKENTIQEMESLSQNNIGVSFALADYEKVSINGELKYIENSFEGSAFTPVAYQILEGLQPGTNLTWTLVAQKRITKFLDLNLSYFGRSSKSSRTVHTGNVQIKAFF